MKKHLLITIIILSFYVKQNLSAQSNFYHIDSIPEVKIYFEQQDWDYLLDSFYVAGEKERLLATLEINGEVLDSVGIRYKGFSSVSTNRDKNPFNIKLDFVKGKQKYDGIDKIKLSNVIQDPSFLREVLSYEIARKYMPASLANYAKVYINDVYWGLYTNVEAVNKDFLVEHYGSNDNAFFKCNPEELDFDGENSNLANSYGTDITNYYPYYDLESDEGWTDLYELIDILNENPDDIETVLNVDRTLWMHAFNYALINFDSYIGYAQNYYVYKDDNSQFNPILWDLNQSFASYRLADASEFFDGFSIEQAKTMDPLLHYSSVSVYPRPLMRNLFENDTYRRMYIAHMRTIMEENFASQEYAQRSQYLQTLISEDVLADTNKFYGDDDFYNNINSTVSDLVDYPGITDLMDARTTYLQSYPGYQGAPTISNIDYTPTFFSIGDDLWITTEITNASTVVLAYRFGGNDLFLNANMLDDGMHNDGAANDGIYGIQINDVGNSIQYYIYAENASAGRFSPERAAYEFYIIQSDINAGDVVINECMASNGNTVSDEQGENDDWLELYNTTDYVISTAGLYLSDEMDDLKKWSLPDVSISSGGYLLIWADNDEDQGALHANFKLSSTGELLTLVNEDELMIDSVSFAEQIEDISFGRIPNGTGPFVAMPPTPNAINSLIIAVDELENNNFTLSPNPTQGIFYLHFEKEKPREIKVYSMSGKLLKTQSVHLSESVVKVHMEHFPGGLYFVNLAFGDFIINRKIILNQSF